jgi:periplasmic mercuric ion binding protein
MTSRAALTSPLLRPALRRASRAAALAIALLGVSLGAAAQSAASGANTLKLSVNGMVCAFCAQGIEARLKALPETGSLYISLKDKIVAVQPKPGQSMPLEKVKAEVIEAGYEVTAHEVVPTTVAALRQEARARK